MKLKDILKGQSNKTITEADDVQSFNKLSKIPTDYKAPNIQIKNQTAEEIRKVAQSLAAVKQQLMELQKTTDGESTVNTIATNTLKHVVAAQKSFLQIKSQM